MDLHCPYCEHSMPIKSAKPGKYAIKCRQCEKKFRVDVPAAAGQPIRTQRLDDGQPDAPKSAGDAHPDATLAQTPQTSPPSGTKSPSKTHVAAPSANRDDQTTEAEPAANSPAATMDPTPADPAATHAATGVASAQNARPAPSAPQAPTIASVDCTLPGPATGAPAGGAAGGFAETDAGAQPTRHIGTTSRPIGADGVPEKLGGYRLIKELGAGAMGSVYLARQLSLDRNVALKVIQARWAREPMFLARFTREAYAAAQLVHPNVIQIYDFGVDAGTHFFSMEFVEGRSLGDVVRSDGKMDCDLAVGYILQAARGLKFAHDRGMVHRDVKPDNLMLSDQGFVKVADLGLVKVPNQSDAGATPAPADSVASGSRADLTQLNIAMGTPDFIAPEQAENAAAADKRADIYSLGCTLYMLLTGAPPFTGKSAIEVITKHKSEPMVRPDVVVKHVPPELSTCTLRMTAKRLEDRYSDMSEVINDLQKYLGIEGVERFSPREEHVKTLEESVAAFYRSSMAALRPNLALGFFALAALICIVAAMLGFFAVAGGALAAMCSATLVYFVASGLKTNSHLFQKARELVYSSRRSDWITFAIGGLLLLVLLLVLGQLAAWLFGALLGAGLAMVLVWVFDRQVAADRQPALDQMEQLLKALRLRGLEEAALEQFVAKYSGPKWEEFFEDLFGYEAKLTQRKLLAASGAARSGKRFRGWRDPIVGWIDRRVTAIKREKEQSHLKQVEEEGLKAEGMSPAEARAMAEEMAKDMVREALASRTMAATSVTGAKTEDPAAKRARIKKMLSEARLQSQEKSSALSMISGALNLFFGARVRFIAGALLLTAFFLWVRQNGWLGGASVEDITSAAAAIGDSADSTSLTLPRVPAALTAPLSGLGAGAAGVILILSSLFSGWRMSLFALPAAVIALLGPALGIPGLGPLASPNITSIAIAGGLAVLGLFFGRTREDF